MITMKNNTTLTTPSALCTGVVVSTKVEHGHFHTADFASDEQAVQYAYDTMITDPKLPRTLILDAPDRPCLSLFGNAFGSKNSLHNAVDWGEQEGKQASWAANTLHLTGEPFLGVPPRNADIVPFQNGGYDKQ